MPPVTPCWQSNALTAAFIKDGQLHAARCALDSKGIVVHHGWCSEAVGQRAVPAWTFEHPGHIPVCLPCRAAMAEPR